jgi:hypothetical protein
MTKIFQCLEALYGNIHLLFFFLLFDEGMLIEVPKDGHHFLYPVKYTRMPDAVKLLII